MQLLTLKTLPLVVCKTRPKNQLKFLHLCHTGDTAVGRFLNTYRVGTIFDEGKLLKQGELLIASCYFYTYKIMELHRTGNFIITDGSSV